MTEDKAFYGVQDIAERYHISKCKAYSIIRAIKVTSDGYIEQGKRPRGALPGAKVLPSELKKWEESYGIKSTATAERRNEQ